jgi:predicted acyl esterase
MISIVALPDPIINVPYQNGALVLAMAEWMAIIEGKTNLPSEIYDTQNLLWHLPLSTMDRKFGWKSSIWKDWLNHSSSDELWKETFYQDKLKNIHIPVLHISGWYDDLIGTYINFSTISNNISLDQKIIKN